MATIKNGLADIDLRLVQPNMSTPKYPVNDAQWLLSGHNRYKVNFLPGQHDGVYGPTTASATRRAKYLLGYPSRSVNSEFGPYLYGYLVGEGENHYIKRPLTYQMRGAPRIHAWKQAHSLKAARERATSLALTQVGYVESPPGSNQTKYGDWYGFNGPWCAMFESWCFSHVGRPMHYAAVSDIYHDGLYHLNGLQFVGTPIRGDLVVLENIGHTGIFLGWGDPNMQTFRYVSGNTSSANTANGGAVEIHLLDRSIVNAWVRVS